MAYGHPQVLGTKGSSVTSYESRPAWLARGPQVPLPVT